MGNIDKTRADFETAFSVPVASLEPEKGVVMLFSNPTEEYTDKGKYETSLDLAELEKKLCEPEFMRCHRLTIIRVSRISQVEPYGLWTYLVNLDGIKETALMTKENFDRVREWYG